MQSYDLIFLGGGLASGLQARFLKLRHPELKILILDPRTTASHSPGESTVGVAGMFLIRDLGLSTYLYLNHLPKNGLRYWFLPEHESTKTTWEAASEIGSNILPVFPTWQVNRKKLDEDLWDLNREIGIDIWLNISLGEHPIQFGEDEHPHTIHCEKDGQPHQIHTQWLFQSQGRLRRVIDSQSLRIWDEEHSTAASWGRYRYVRDLDSILRGNHHRKVGYTSRYLSTNHIMGKGYWIWIIPIGEGLVSLGIVWDKNICSFSLKTSEELTQFFKSHPLIRDLSKDLEAVDFQHGPHLAHYSENYIPARRVAIVGDSAHFVDPFYSPGSDALARQAFLLEHLICEQAMSYEDRAELFENAMRMDRESLKLLYQNQYAGFASFELFNIKSLWDFHSYTNRVLWPFYQNFWASAEWVKIQVEFQRRGLALTRAFQSAFQDLASWLDSQKALYRKNQGEYSLRQNRFFIEELMLDGLYSDEDSLRQHLDLCRYTLSELMDLRFELKGILLRPLFHDNLLFSHLEKFTLTENWLQHFLHRVSQKLSRQLEAEIKLEPNHLYSDSPPLEGLDNKQKEALIQIWQEPVSNLVLQYLNGTSHRLL